uniref:IP18142p n=1 Tax=Drosophila melanogaster TaxID=7227 RepID=A2VEQ1_DROME|nr:IP18142p [Drosophila melanogaster]
MAMKLLSQVFLITALIALVSSASLGER